MIFPDINLLLYAEVLAFPHHVRARAGWEGLLRGEREVAIAPFVLFGFVRLATNPRVLDIPMTVDAALNRVLGWLDLPHVHLATPGPRHLEIAFAGSAGEVRIDERSLVVIRE